MFTAILPVPYRTSAIPKVLGALIFTTAIIGLATPAHAGETGASEDWQAMMTTSPTASTSTGPSREALLWHYGSGAATTAVSLPLTLALSTYLGSKGNHMNAAIPALLSVLVLPPLFTMAGQWWMGNRLQKDSSRVFPAVLAAYGVHLLVLTAAILGGATTHDLGDASLLTLAEAVLMPAAITGIYYWQYGPPPAAKTTGSVGDDAEIKNIPAPQPLPEQASLRGDFAPRLMIPLIKVGF